MIKQMKIMFDQLNDKQAMTDIAVKDFSVQKKTISFAHNIIIYKTS